MWARRCHMVAPSNQITSSKVKFKWNKIEQDALDKIKWTLARDTLLTYQNFSKEFNFHTNASDFQIGVVISQRGKTINFYSRKILMPKEGIH